MVYLSDSTIGSSLIVGSGLIGICFGFYQHYAISDIKITTQRQPLRPTEGTPLVNRATTVVETRNLINFHSYIQDGVRDYFRSAYGLCLSFSLCFAFILFCIFAWSYQRSPIAIAMGISYLVGSLLASTVGAVGAYESVSTGVRTTISVQEDGNIGYIKGFTAAFRGGAAFSFLICGVCLLATYGFFEATKVLVSLYDQTYPTTTILFIGMAFGMSVVALFVRIGGGNFSTSMDIGSNLIGKVMFDIAEENPNNPAGNFHDFSFLIDM
jgi:Na+/H+-translocating membrane pyrophosphatase